MLNRIFKSQKVNLPSQYHQRLRTLMREEAKIGASLFGYLPNNSTREFFMLDSNTWIWHEEWNDSQGTHMITTRYEIHGEKIIKIQNHGPAHMVEGEELRNFYNAVIAYYYQVAEKVYNRPIPPMQQGKT